MEETVYNALAEEALAEEGEDVYGLIYQVDGFTVMMRSEQTLDSEGGEYLFVNKMLFIGN